MFPVERSNWIVSGKKIKRICVRQKGQTEMCPVKRSYTNVPGKKDKLKCAR